MRHCQHGRVELSSMEWNPLAQCSSFILLMRSYSKYMYEYELILQCMFHCRFILCANVYSGVVSKHLPGILE